MRHQIVYLFFFADFYFAPMYLFIFFFLVVIVYIYFMIYKGVKRHHICLPVIVTSCFPEPSRYSLWNIKGKGIRRNKNRICKFVIQRIKQSLVLVSFFTAVILGTSCKLTFIIHNLNEHQDLIFIISNISCLLSILSPVKHYLQRLSLKKLITTNQFITSQWRNQVFANKG